MDSRRRNQIAQWAFDTRAILGRFHLWLEDVEEEWIQGGRKDGFSFAGDSLDRAFVMAVAVTAKTDVVIGDTGQTRDARIVVVGDSDFVSNAHVEDFFNKEFLLNAIAWLSGQEELIAERPKGFRASRLDMTEADYRTLFRFGVLLFPEALLIVGLAVWWRRRTLMVCTPGCCC